MTVSINADYDELTLISTAIDGFVSNTSNALSLQITHNCGTPKVINVLIGDITTGSPNRLVLTPQDLGMTTVFSNGIYKIYLNYQASSQITDTHLFYAKKDVECALMEYYGTYKDCILLKRPCEKNEPFWAFAFHYLLDRIGTCGDFTYEQACVVYEQMDAILAKDYDCGC